MTQKKDQDDQRVKMIQGMIRMVMRIQRIKRTNMTQCLLPSAASGLSSYRKTGHSLSFGDAAAAVWVIAAKYVREGGSVLVGQAGRLALAGGSCLRLAEHSTAEQGTAE